MGDGNVIALEVVVDVNLPIAVDDVIAALAETFARALGPALWGQKLMKARTSTCMSKITISVSTAIWAAEYVSVSSMFSGGLDGAPHNPPLPEKCFLVRTSSQLRRKIF